MPRTQDNARLAGIKAAITRKERKNKQRNAGFKAAKTRKRNRLLPIQRKIGIESASKQKQRILFTKEFFASLIVSDSQVCAVCGESMKNTLDNHHIDGDRTNNDSSNLVTICASCHRILDKANSPEEALLNLKERHKRNR